MRYIVILNLALFSIFSLNVAQADQTDKHLDTLFNLLHTTESRYQGAEITRQIWVRWHDTDNSDVESLMDTGIAFMQDNKYKNALVVFNKIVQIAPDYAEGWNKRATVYYLMGDFNNSSRDVDKTLELEPRHFGAIAGQGYIDLKQGNQTAAASRFKKALEINPFLSDIKSHLMKLEQELRDSIV